VSCQWKNGIPLEVVPMAYVPVMDKLKEMKGKPTLRMAQKKVRATNTNTRAAQRRGGTPHSRRRVWRAVCSMGFTLSFAPPICPVALRAALQAGPVVTDNGNFVLDVDFGALDPARVAELDRQLQSIVGVVETGLFVGIVEKAYFGQADGSVTSR
jgi:ribose 5-phosphate isomerase A